MVHCRWSDTPAFFFLFLARVVFARFWVRLFLQYLSMCIFYVLCVGCSVRSVVLCAVLIYQTIFLYTGAVRCVLCFCAYEKHYRRCTLWLLVHIKTGLVHLAYGLTYYLYPNSRVFVGCGCVLSVCVGRLLNTHSSM